MSIACTTSLGMIQSFDDSPAAIREAPLWCVVPLCLTAAGCVVLFFFADSVYALLHPLVTP